MSIIKGIYEYHHKSERARFAYCDVCGDRSPVEWSVNEWGELPAVAETTVELKQGTNYGSDGGSVRTTAFHVCPKCFEEVLVPWFLDRCKARPTVTHVET